MPVMKWILFYCPGAITISPWAIEYASEGCRKLIMEDPEYVVVYINAVLDEGFAVAIQVYCRCNNVEPPPVHMFPPPFPINKHTTPFTFLN